MILGVLTSGDLQVRNYHYSSFSDASRRAGAGVVVVGAGVHADGRPLSLRERWRIATPPQLTAAQQRWTWWANLVRELRVVALGWQDLDSRLWKASYVSGPGLGALAARSTLRAKRAAARLGLAELIGDRATRLPPLDNLRSWVAGLGADVLLLANPYSAYQTLVAHAASRDGVPYLVVPHSFDNVYNHGPLLAPVGPVVVWGPRMRDALLAADRQLAGDSVLAEGYPGFDMHRDPKFFVSREEVCLRHGLDPGRPFWVFTGEPEVFVPDQGQALRRLFAGITGDPRLWDVQLLVRPHPHDRNRSLERAAHALGVAVQRPWDTQEREVAGGRRMALGGGVPTWDDMVDHVNAFRHAQAVIAYGSTTILDAAVHDLPVVQLRTVATRCTARCERMVRGIHKRAHLRGIAEDGAVTPLETWDEMSQALLEVAQHPELRRDARRRSLAMECVKVDGCAGERVLGLLVRALAPEPSPGTPVPDEHTGEETSLS